MQSAEMSGAASFASARPASGWLSLSVRCWLAVTLCGQWLFAAYIGLLYGWPLWRGQPALVNLTEPITGYVAGDSAGNLMYFGHILPAMLLSLGGVLQLIPQLRTRWPRLHRWNGRLFLTLGVSGALTGLWLTWGRESRLSDVGAIGLTLNGLLIPLAAGLAFVYARRRDFARHQRAAIHCFLLINGVWTFRLWLMSWYLLNQGPWGNTNQLDGPVDLFISVGCYALPMAVAELWFWARRQPAEWVQRLTAAVFSLASLVTAFGIVAAVVVLWWPPLAQLLQAA